MRNTYRPQPDPDFAVDSGGRRVSSRARVDMESARVVRSRCPELDCLRTRLTPAQLAFAEQRALALGVSAERVVVAERMTSEDAYVVALAAWLRLAFEPLGELSRADCRRPDEQLADANAAGWLPLTVAGQPTWVCAPLTASARSLIAIVRSRPELIPHIRLTSARRLREFVRTQGAAYFDERAANGLRTAHPALSAGGRGPPRGVACAVAFAGLASALITMPDAVLSVASIALAVVFCAWTGLRLIGALTPWRRWQPHNATTGELPVYTVIVALHDEAEAVSDLIDALRKLDYPPEKLQVILALEPDDRATQAAIARLALGLPFEIVISPAIGPRTKPKALNAALAFARGTFVAVFDAEDRPAPDQLHRALDVFLGEGETIACVQAKLCIDNTRDGLLARMFTAEYAGLFDVLLPGLARLRLPLPLGGSSNHFRTNILRDVGGWDAYNVTEDADLGMRLARRGYQAAVIESTTFEEAPYRLKHWVPQRTRWFKGWIQTWVVHMRQPTRLAGDLGPSGFMAFQLVVGGTVLAALVHPFVLVWLAYGMSMQGWSSVLGPQGLSVVAGYSASMALGFFGLARRRMLSQSAILLSTPIHWLLLSFAAWRALLQLPRNPYRWEKTAHGLAKHREAHPAGRT